MSEFLSNNWVWILLLGGMLFMHLGHGGGHGGCGGHQHSGTDHDQADDEDRSHQDHGRVS